MSSGGSFRSSWWGRFHGTLGSQVHSSWIQSYFCSSVSHLPCQDHLYFTSLAISTKWSIMWHVLCHSGWIIQTRLCQGRQPSRGRIILRISLLFDLNPLLSSPSWVENDHSCHFFVECNEFAIVIISRELIFCQVACKFKWVKSYKKLWSSKSLCLVQMPIISQQCNFSQAATSKSKDEHFRERYVTVSVTSLLLWAWRHRDEANQDSPKDINSFSA